MPPAPGAAGASSSSESSLSSSSMGSKLEVSVGLRMLGTKAACCCRMSRLQLMEAKKG